MTENTLLLVGLCITLLAAIAILVITVGARREVRNISDDLDQRYAQLKAELNLAREERSAFQQEAQQATKQMEKQLPEKLTWELEQTTKELERLRNEHSENLRLAGLKEREWVYRDEQQEHQRLHLERECQNRMEELEQWRIRYTEVQERAKWLEQERSRTQQKVEELAQLKGRLLKDIQELEGATPLSRGPDHQPTPLEIQANQANMRR